ncbi:MAG: DnaJ domain-containing protein [Alphaproteobacteria bacterium]|nr:DnaJ domain-containing protein [Alphaproteobacteria bacterium]
MRDPYTILGVPRSASADEIRRAYRKLAKELHPDARPGDATAEDRFKQVTQAFKLLSNAETRAKFDRGEIDAEGRERAPFHYRSHPDAPPGQRGPAGRFEDISDLFSDLFAERARASGQGAGAGARRNAPGPDMRGDIVVSFEESVLGARKRVSLQGARAIEIVVPAGVEDGQVLRLRGQGAPSPYGGPSGDALITVRIAPHALFQRDGRDIRIDLPISLKEAVLGGVVRAPTVDGVVEVRVPAGSTSGALLRLRGKGASGPDGKRGDQIIRLIIDVPPGDPALESFVETWTPPAGYDPRRRRGG